MNETPDRLFSADGAAVLAAWGLAATDQELSLHNALTVRKLTPDESHLRAAAAWLGRVFAYHGLHPRFDEYSLARVLGEKCAMLVRMAHRHVPALGSELEGDDSPLRPIEAAARFIPPVRPATSRHLARLRREVAAIELRDSPPAGADVDWHDNRRRLRDLVLQDTPARFLTWPVLINTMFMDDSSTAAPELRALQARPDYAIRWLPALREDALGAPARTPLLSASSNNLIHHAYNLLQLELSAEKPVERLSSIVEFGGGYGSCARLAFRLGFRGRYVIFDLPEFSALQRYYLGTLGFPVDSAIQCVSTVDELRTRLREPDLFLATWSFSETPLALREELLPIVQSARFLLLAYQHIFGARDNLRYFAELAGKLVGKAVHDYAIPHLPGNRYFIATQREGAPGCSRS
jgi:hypothetical protein